MFADVTLYRSMIARACVLTGNTDELYNGRDCLKNGRDCMKTFVSRFKGPMLHENDQDRAQTAKTACKRPRLYMKMGKIVCKLYNSVFVFE